MIINFEEKAPNIHETAYVANNATIVGNVTIGKNSSVWFNAVLRGDSSNIIIGENSNIQDNCVIHMDEDDEVRIGDNVTIGHGAIIHGCVIEDNCLIGMGAIILNGAVIKRNSIIGAGALVTQNKVIPENSLVVGAPAKVKRQLTSEEILSNKESAAHYVSLSKKY